MKYFKIKTKLFFNKIESKRNIFTKKHCFNPEFFWSVSGIKLSDPGAS